MTTFQVSYCSLRRCWWVGATVLDEGAMAFRLEPVTRHDTEAEARAMVAELEELVSVAYS